MIGPGSAHARGGFNQIALLVHARPAENPTLTPNSSAVHAHLRTPRSPGHVVRGNSAGACSSFGTVSRLQVAIEDVGRGR